MIDDLYVLHEGEMVYAGPAQQMVPYFTNLGYHFDPYHNPLEVLFMDVLNIAQQDEFARDEGQDTDDDDDVGSSSKAQDGKNSTVIIPSDQLVSHYKQSPLYATMLQVAVITGGTTKECCDSEHVEARLSGCY